jgi:tRNA 2-selenouridine synthase
MKKIEAEALELGDYHEVIDVRAPLEFAEDHLPGAINLFVLSDEERERVGTIYKQESVFEAKKIGAAMVSANISSHITSKLMDKPGGYRPLIYCWRGGQRSHAMATVLDQIGWPVTLLEGGYKAFRRRVLEDLQTLPSRFQFRVLAGLTGTGKTEILHRLAERGEQVLDLEGLANHQGSLLGEPPGGQCVSQKQFDTRLWHALQTMDSDRPVWTEAESPKIGQVHCPKDLIKMLRSSLRIEMVVPIDDRVAYLNQRYDHWQGNPDGLLAKLKWLNQRHGQAEVNAWTALARAGDWHAFVKRLLETHYDPAYRGALANGSDPAHELSASGLLAEGCEQAAEALLAMKFA